MPTNEYHFIDPWRVEGSAEEVAALIEDGEGLPRWWPSTYIDVRTLESGGENQIGRVSAFRTKGWLPCTLRWNFRVVEREHPRRFALEAFGGDFDGLGVWTFEQDGPHVLVTFDWRVRSNKPLMGVCRSARRLSFCRRRARRRRG